MNIINFSLLCGLTAIIYGIFVSKSILSVGTGTSKMLEISKQLDKTINPNKDLIKGLTK